METTQKIGRQTIISIRENKKNYKNDPGELVWVLLKRIYFQTDSDGIYYFAKKIIIKNITTESKSMEFTEVGL